MRNMKSLLEGLQAISGMLQESFGKKEKFVGKDARLTYDDYLFRLEELPQKGKKKLRVARMNHDANRLSGWQQSFSNHMIVDNVIRLAKLSSSDGYDIIKKKIFDAIMDSIEKAKQDPSYAQFMQKHKHDPLNPDYYKWYEDLVYFTQVTPEGSEPIKVKGRDFNFTSYYDKFEVYSPQSDFNQLDPFYTGREAKSKEAARRLYNILRSNPNILSNLYYKDLDGWFKQNRIATRYLQSVWR